MRILLLWLVAWLATGTALAQKHDGLENDSTELLSPAPYTLRFQSYEEPSAGGKLQLLLLLTARQEIPQSGY